jgi:RNA polymerase sigma factor (sigma-70 family)
LKGQFFYTDDQLIAGIKTRNNYILDYILKSNFRPIKQFIILNNGSEADAQDILQEAIIIVYRKVQHADFKLTSSLSTFIYSIAKLLWLKEIGKRGRKIIVHDTDETIVDSGNNIQETIEYNERLKLYRQKYDELSEDCRKVLMMFLMKIPIPEITKIMGYSSEQHTRNRRYRCKESLINRIRETQAFKELGYENDTIN